MKRKGLAKDVYIACIYIALYLPLFVLVLYSFNDARYSMQWKGFTLQWYSELLLDTDLWYATLRSLVLASCTVCFALVLGLIAALNFYQLKFKGRKFFNASLFTLIILPDIVIALNFLLSFKLIGMDLGFKTLLIAHVSFCIPFVFIILSNRLNALDESIVDAGYDLGASEYYVFKQIIYPLLKPSMIYASLLSFTLSFDDLVISYFVSGPGYEILPLKIYSMVRSGIKPQINALSTVVIGTMCFFIWYFRKYVQNND